MGDETWYFGKLIKLTLGENSHFGVFLGRRWSCSGGVPVPGTGKSDLETLSNLSRLHACNQDPLLCPLPTVPDHCPECK